ncbi:MAG TPA: hypothetical protein VHC20_04355 [Candidatus Paceibacterota bacterium]|nr:hypothetical protein [Candidatus Paceibacterota bacterium]
MSWNLMIGKNPLWASTAARHSIATMLRVYAAWVEGAVESDVEAIERSMNPQLTSRAGARRVQEHCKSPLAISFVAAS